MKVKPTRDSLVSLPPDWRKRQCVGCDWYCARYKNFINQSLGSLNVRKCSKMDWGGWRGHAPKTQNDREKEGYLQSNINTFRRVNKSLNRLLCPGRCTLECNSFILLLCKGNPVERNYSILL